MTSVTYNIRLDEGLKNEAFSVIQSFGMTPAQAIKLFLKQTAQTKSIPLNFDYEPNATTKQALDEAKQDRTPSQTFDNIDELMGWLNAKN